MRNLHTMWWRAINFCELKLNINRMQHHTKNESHWGVYFFGGGFMNRFVYNQIARACLFFSFFVFASWQTPHSENGIRNETVAHIKWYRLNNYHLWLFPLHCNLSSTSSTTLPWLAVVVVVVGAQFLLKLFLSSEALLRIINKLLHKNRLQTWCMGISAHFSYIIQGRNSRGFEAHWTFGYSGNLLLSIKISRLFVHTVVFVQLNMAVQVVFSEPKRTMCSELVLELGPECFRP